MKKASIIMAVLSCAIIAAAYTNSVPISTNTRAATEKWTAIRFEPALPPTPANAASKFLDGNREWQTVTAAQIGALTNETDEAALAALNATNAVLRAAITNEAALRAAHIVRTDNPHNVTAPQIGALTNEQDLAALRTYHYGSPDIHESPAEWFVFNGAGTITAFNWQAGRENVVIPWAIGGVPVTAIGGYAFDISGVVSLIAPQTVTSIGDGAFASCTSLTSVSLPQVQTVGYDAFSGCTSLTSVSLPQAQTVGEVAFYYCTSLTSVSLPNAQTVGAHVFNSCGVLASVSLPQAQAIGGYAFISCTSLASVYFDNNAPTIGVGIFEGITPNQVTNYVTNPQAKGWGATFGGMPVVRLPLYADAIYQAGELVATTGYVAQAIAAIPEPDLSDRPTFAQIAASNALPYTAWTGTVTPQNGTATVAYAHGNMPVLVVPNGGGTTRVTVATGTYAATSGVSRVSLSIWAGTNTIELVTNEVDYATAPDIPTNGWGTILFRRVSNGRWKGVGL